VAGQPGGGAQARGAAADDDRIQTWHIELRHIEFRRIETWRNELRRIE
jgi:hypothetical protein